MIASLSKEDELSILMLSEVRKRFYASWNTCADMETVQMAFTGYVFETKEEVQKVAEQAGKGPTFRWCQRHACRLNCMVLCGYVELGVDGDEAGCLYNSMMVLSPDGELVCNPRKTFLYETDKHWATAGSEFKTWYCPWLDKTISFGICMDINPCDFAAPFEAFEFASQVVTHGSDLVLFSCAWCDFEPPESDSFPTFSYWATRLTPIIKALKKGTYPKSNSYFVCSNRIGSENGTFFVGASCALSLKEPMLLAHAERLEETVLRVELPKF